MDIDSLLAQVVTHVTEPTNQPNLVIPDDWSQGRTCYGGLSAALVYQAIQTQVEPNRAVRAFNCSFVGPLQVESDFRIEVEVLRQGKNVSQVVGKAVQNDQVQVICTAAFGVDRQSKIEVQNKVAPNFEPPKRSAFLPQIPKVTPKYLRHFEMAISDGAIPFTGSKKDFYKGWMKFKQAPKHISVAHLICMFDCWPPTTLQMLRWPKPASTMSWSIDFIHPFDEIAPKNWVAYHNRTRQAQNGYTHAEADIWDDQGQLIALSRQAVTIFD